MSPTRRSAVAVALVLGWVGAAASLAYTIFWLTQLLTLRGGDRIIMLNTLVTFAVVVWIWVACAVVALVIDRRASPRSRAVTIAVTATFVLTGVCAIFTVITLFV